MKDPVFVRNRSCIPKIIFPAKIRWKYKWPAGILILGASSWIYFIAGKMVAADSAKPALLFRLDFLIPFLPWTVWIYLSIYIYICAVFFLNRCTLSLNRHLYSFFFLVLTCSLIFMIFPTHYPRELYPIPAQTGTATKFLLNLLRNADPPTNNAPSLHVGVAYLIALGFLDDLQKFFPWVFLWATLLSISTLTTKQHSLIDILMGMGMAILFYLFFHRGVQYRMSHQN